MQKIKEQIDALRKQIAAEPLQTTFSGIANDQLNAVKDSLIWHEEALAKAAKEKTKTKTEPAKTEPAK